MELQEIHTVYSKHIKSYILKDSCLFNPHSMLRHMVTQTDSQSQLCLLSLGATVSKLSGSIRATYMREGMVPTKL